MTNPRLASALNVHECLTFRLFVTTSEGLQSKLYAPDFRDCFCPASFSLPASISIVWSTHFSCFAIAVLNPNRFSIDLRCCCFSKPRIVLTVGCVVPDNKHVPSKQEVMTTFTAATEELLPPCDHKTITAEVEPILFDIGDRLWHRAEVARRGLRLE